MNKNQVYRSIILNNSTIQTQMLFRVPTQVRDPNILDVIVSDNFTIIRYDNYTVTAYLRPRNLGDFATRSRQGSINLNSNGDSIVTHFTNAVLGGSLSADGNHSFFLYFSPNLFSNNMIIQYQFFQTYSAQGVLLDISVRTVQQLNI